MTSGFFVWRMAVSEEYSDIFSGFLFCQAAPVDPALIPPEVSLMLPNRDGQAALLKSLEAGRSELHDQTVGLFLSDPFLRLEPLAERLKSNGVDTVVNFPSVEQQDLEFTSLLSDVGLDKNLEHENLSALSNLGFKIGVVANTEDGAADAAGLSPAFMLVVPKVPDFAAGFPSMRQRGTLAQAVRRGAAKKGWKGPILTIGQETEADFPTLWPDGVAGVVSFTG